MTQQFLGKPKSLKDDWQSPVEAIQLLFEYIPANFKLILEPACGNGNISNFLISKGKVVISRDILTGSDFLLEPIPPTIDAIITNPPFSSKTQFIQRCVDSDKPWALLLPITALEGKRGKLLKGTQLLIPNKRINFEFNGEQKNGCFFTSIWITSGFGLEKDLNFVEL